MKCNGCLFNFSRSPRLARQYETSLAMIYALTLPENRSPYLTNSVTEYRRHEMGVAQQKDLETTFISGLPTYQDAISTYKTDPSNDKQGDMPPPYTLIWVINTASYVYTFVLSCMVFQVYCIIANLGYEQHRM